MHWITNLFGSSIGKKLLMAFTGLCFISFLSVHLAGNLTLYGGKALFNSYAEHLHALGPIILLAEWGLLFLAVVHVLTGAILFFQNLNARPKRYKVNKQAGGRTWSSQTMPYTGFIILIFIVFHLLNFHFIDQTHTTIYQIVSAAFQNTMYVFIYIAAMVVVALHIRHGFWSLFQTFGANHPKYMAIVMVASVVLSLVFGIGFGFLPIYLSISG
jgi:succinate dehydrogenase / fumarate reductase, cytochrome b subunit